MLTVGLIPSEYHPYVLQIVLIVHFTCFRCVEVSSYRQWMSFRWTGPYKQKNIEKSILTWNIHMRGA